MVPLVSGVPGDAEKFPTRMAYDMDFTKPYEFIGFGAMDVTKPYRFRRFGAMDVTKPYNFTKLYCICSYFGGKGEGLSFSDSIIGHSPGV